MACLIQIVTAIKIDESVGPQKDEAMRDVQRVATEPLSVRVRVSFLPGCFICLALTRACAGAGGRNKTPYRV